MKKIKAVLALTLLFLVLGCSSAIAAEWTIEVNNKSVDAEVKIIEGRSLIPLRAVGEALGLDVAWDGEKQAVYLVCTLNNIDNVVVLYVPTATADIGIQGDSESTENNVNKYLYHEKGFELEVPPSNIDGRVYVPVRFVCNLFGAPLQVDGNNIKIGDIFTAEKRGDIEGLRKKPEPVKEPEIILAGKAPVKVLEDILTASNQIADHGRVCIKYVNNALDYANEQEFINMLKGKKNPAALAEIEKARSEIIKQKAFCDKAIELCANYEDTQKMKAILQEVRTNLATAIAFDSSLIDYTFTAKFYVDNLSNASNLLETEFLSELETVARTHLK